MGGGGHLGPTVKQAAWTHHALALYRLLPHMETVDNRADVSFIQAHILQPEQTPHASSVDHVCVCNIHSKDMPFREP